MGVTDLLSLRRAFYRSVGPMVPIPAARQARMERGRSVHRSFGSRLSEGGILEARVRRDGLVGRVDILAEIPIEVKTATALVASTDILAQRPDHVEQLGMYCALVNQPTGRLLTLVVGPTSVSEVQALDISFRSTSTVLEEMRRRADLFRAAVGEGRVDGLPRCPWFRRGCEYEEASVCNCQGDEEPPTSFLTEVTESPRLRQDVGERVRSALSEMTLSVGAPTIERFREVLYPRRAYFDRTVPPSVSPETKAPATSEPDFWSRLTEAVEGGPPGEVARLPAKSAEPEEEVVGFRRRPMLVKTSRAWERFRETELVRRAPQYILELGLRCAVTGSDSGLVVVGFERADVPRDRIQVLEVRFTSMNPFSRLFRERSRDLAEALRQRNPTGVAPCPAWMAEGCPYRLECGCGPPGARLTR